MKNLNGAQILFDVSGKHWFGQINPVAQVYSMHPSLLGNMGTYEDGTVKGIEGRVFFLQLRVPFLRD